MKLTALYLSYVNEFITVDAFASYYGLTRKVALRVIVIGRYIQNRA